MQGGFSLTLQQGFWRVTYASELYQPAARELSFQSLAPRGDVNIFSLHADKRAPGAQEQSSKREPHPTLGGTQK